MKLPEQGLGLGLNFKQCNKTNKTWVLEVTRRWLSPTCPLPLEKRGDKGNTWLRESQKGSCTAISTHPRPRPPLATLLLRGWWLCVWDSGDHLRGSLGKVVQHFHPKRDP
jgi:hypothetical protein